jgi:signal transduction histidine kinase
MVSMSKSASSSLIASRRMQLATIALIFVVLIILRHLIGAFMFSLGYLYVGVISLSGFWFGIRGGIIAATAAAAIFVVEILALQDLVARDVALNGIYLRFFVYILAGVVLGYLSRAAQRRTAMIERLNEQKNIFVGMAAHDLRNPLSSIALTSCILLDDIDTKPLTTDKIKVTLRAIHDASERMLTLIDDILDITAIEAGRLDLNLSRCSYAELVQRNAEVNGIIAQQDDIDIVVSAASDMPDLVIDAIKIDQVLNNLVGNAIKFTPSGTAVTITVTAASGEVMTSVADEGPGIAPEDLPYIFNEFYRSKHGDDLAVHKKSTGLGLAIVKHIVEEHGGRIWAENKPGTGAIFTFTLPVASMS